MSTSLSLSRVLLDTFDPAAVAGLIAAALGVPQSSVVVAVRDYELGTTLTLRGNVSSLTEAQRLTITSTFAVKLSVSFAQVTVTPLQLAAHRRRLLTASALEFAVSVAGLGSNAAVVRSMAQQLSAPATMTALVAGLNDPTIVSADATPAYTTVELSLTLTIPPLMAPGSMLASLNVAMSTSLSSALSSAGYTVASATSFVLAPPAPVVLALPPTKAVVSPGRATISRRTIAIAAGCSVAGLLCAGAVWFGAHAAALRGGDRVTVRHARASLIRKSMPFIADDEPDEEEPDTPSPRDSTASAAKDGQTALEIALRSRSRASEIFLRFTDVLGHKPGPRRDRSALEEAQFQSRWQDMTMTSPPTA